MILNVSAETLKMEKHQKLSVKIRAMNIGGLSILVHFAIIKSKIAFQYSQSIAQSK